MPERTSNREWRHPAAAALLLAVAVTAVATAERRATHARWRGMAADAALIVTDDLPPAEVAERIAALVPADRDDHLVVRFRVPPTATERGRLAAAGVTLQSSLGDGTWFAQVDGRRLDRAALAAVGALAAADVVPREATLHPLLRERALPAWSRADGMADGSPPADGTEVLVQVLFHRDVERRAARRAVRASGGRVVSALRAVNALVVALPAGRLDALADRHVVQWIEPPLPPLAAMNDANRALTQADAVQPGSGPGDIGGYALTGAGVVVMLYDGGVPLADHVDFGGRVTVRDQDIGTPHATHVAGTIGGDGLASDGLYRGMAPAVTIEAYGLQFAAEGEEIEPGAPIFLYSDPGDVENDYADAVLVRGAVLANNSLATNTASFGFPCEITGDYGLMSHVIDAIVRGGLGPPVRVVWANGNERGSPNCGQSYFTTAPPAGAKNHLTVGAVNAEDASVTDFTSWGPVDDGRLRPDVVAPGCQGNGDGGVTSTAFGDQYGVLCGTSMATPTVTGCAALLLEDFRERYPARDDFLPSTMKTLFIHAAEDLEAPGPDYRTGYGLVQAKDTIELMRSGRFVEAEVAHGRTLTGVVTVDGPAARLVVTLAWDDPPAAPNVERALVNDLDLRVEGPGGVAWPWTLDPLDPAAPAVRDGPDRVNNVEQVVIDAPAPGVYAVTVTGFDVPEGPQRFSLAASPTLAMTTIELADGGPGAVAPDRSSEIVVEVRGVGEEVVPGSVRLRHRVPPEPFVEIQMTPLGDDRYGAVLPPAPCGETIELFVSAEGSLSGTAMLPPDAPVAVIALPVAEVSVRFDDDFEEDLGWTVENGAGLVTGSWERGVPAGDGLRGDPVLDGDGSGSCYLTFNEPGNSDVDGGATTLVSPRMDASGGGSVLEYRRWLATNWGNAPNEDVLLVEVSDDDGATWRELEVVGPGGPDASGGWRSRSFDLAALPGFAPNDAFRVRFTAADEGEGSVVEAAIDGVALTALGCDGEAVPCPADVDGSGAVDIDDLVETILRWGSCTPGPEPCPDLDGDGTVSGADVAALLAAWGPCE